MFDDLTEEEAILLAAKYIATNQSVPEDLDKLIPDDIKEALYAAKRKADTD